MVPGRSISSLMVRVTQWRADAIKSSNFLVGYPERIDTGAVCVGMYVSPVPTSVVRAALSTMLRYPSGPCNLEGTVFSKAYCTVRNGRCIGSIYYKNPYMRENRRIGRVGIALVPVAQVDIEVFPRAAVFRYQYCLAELSGGRYRPDHRSCS